jgi:hypothetical protein
MRRGIFAVLLALSSAALAQRADVGLVSLVSGDVSYAPFSGPATKVRAFMKVREGDRFSLPVGAQLRVVFYEGARQERWVGPASFRADKEASELITGKAAEVTLLPVGVQQRIASVPELIQYARLGGTSIGGGIMRPRGISLEEPATLRAAHATYAQMQNQMPADDITPEFYLYAVMYEFMLYDEMKQVVAEMRRKQPENDDLKTLETWVLLHASR